MSRRKESGPEASRRGFLAASGGMVAAAAFGRNAAAEAEGAKVGHAPHSATEPFWGEHQSGIITPAQRHTYFAAFDLTATQRNEVAMLLQAWTLAAARMAKGETAQPMESGLKPIVAEAGSTAVAKTGDAYPAKTDVAYEEPDASAEAADTGEAVGLSPARLSLTFGFGAGLFVRDGKDRYGLARQRPAALVDLPKFAGEQLVEAHTGGDLSVQASADDPQVAFHAVRQLARLAGAVAQIRWAQTGFLPGSAPGETPRNLMGFKDGTNNPRVSDPQAMAQVVWVGADGPDWMRGGSYLVVRRIRIALEHWDRMKVAFQEQTFGRHKSSGAPIGKAHEFDALDLDATDKDGNPVIAQNAHVRLAAAANNGGAQILRRAYSYNDGVDFTAERWPPWRQGMEYDAGLLFLAYQSDPRSGFIRIFEKLAKFDMMNQFVTHVGGGLFACPRGAAKGEYIGQRLFETA